MKAYTETLLREIQARKGFFAEGVRPSTLYFGGGTPSLVPSALLGKVADCLRSTFATAAFGEFTLEANPDDVNEESARRWRSIGVNRLSIGVQSFNDERLRWMRRRHDAATARRAVEVARRAGFDNISIDLIFGYSPMSLEEWGASLDAAIELGVEHISCYQMTLEEGSPLWECAGSGEYREPSQEECAAQYALLQEKLCGAGFHQYEISNFAVEGRESRHNSAYWERQPYLGFGPSAHSFDGFFRRFWNPADLDSYLDCRDSSDFERFSSGEILSDKDAADECIMLGLRRSCGFDTAFLPDFCRGAFLEKAAALEKKGLLKRCGSVFSIPADKMFVSDDIISDLFL